MYESHTPSELAPTADDCSVAVPEPRSGQRSAQSILFAFSEREWEWFLPELSSGDVDALGALWVDPGTLTPEEWHNLLRKERPAAILSSWSTPALPEEWLREEGGSLPLRYISHVTGTVRKLVPRSYIEHGVLVTNWGSSISYAIAEHAILLVLASLRNMPRWGSTADCDNDCIFEKMERIRPKSLRGKRVGIHGFGAIAREIVQMLRPFGVEISAWSAGVPRALYDEFGVTQAAGLAELFAGSEVLIECEGLTPATRGLVSADILRLLPDDAVFVNVGRAAVTDETELARLVNEGRVRAGLDVFSPIAGSMRGGILSPHIAGPTVDACPVCGEHALRNLKRYLRGETPVGVMTLEVFDRST